MFYETLWNTADGANKVCRVHRARQLLAKYPASLVNFIVFTDEKVLTVARPTNSHNDCLYARVGTAKKQIGAARLLRTRPIFSRSLMVSVGVSALGTTSIHFIKPGVKVNRNTAGDLYWDLSCFYSVLISSARLASKTLYSSFSLMTSNFSMIKTSTLHRHLVHSSCTW